MKILSISLDPHILNPESVVASRAKAYAQAVTTYIVAVPSPATMRVTLGDNAVAYGSGGVTKIVRLYRMIRLINRIIRSERIDVITVQDPYYLGFVAWLFARYYHLGLEMQILGLEKLSWWRTALARFTLRRSSVVRALSPRLFERLASEYNVPKEHMRIVTIYVDVKKLGLDFATMNVHTQKAFDESVSAFKTTYHDTFNFLTVSRLVPIKNIELQIAAIAALVNEKMPVHLHIVGGGPEEASLRARVAALSLEQQVTFHGPKYHADLGVYYLASDCFLLTSFYEGWGMVVVEALSAGLPVIMTAVGCADELVINGESGLVVPVNDVHALKNAMRQVATDKELRMRLREGAVKAITSLPPLSEVVPQYVANWQLANDRRL